MNEQERKYVEGMVEKYEEKRASKLDELRKLDQNVQQKPMCIALIFGVIGALILGFGMCIAMGVILKNLFYLGIIIGIIGIVFVSTTYFIYKKLLNKYKAKYANQILSLSQELLQE